MITPPSRSYGPVFEDDRHRKEPFAIVVKHTCSVEIYRFHNQDEALRAQAGWREQGYTYYDPSPLCALFRVSPSVPSSESQRFILVEVPKAGQIVIDAHSATVVKQYANTPNAQRAARKYRDRLNAK